MAKRIISIIIFTLFLSLTVNGQATSDSIRYQIKLLEAQNDAILAKIELLKTKLKLEINREAFLNPAIRKESVKCKSDVCFFLRRPGYSDNSDIIVTLAKKNSVVIFIDSMQISSFYLAEQAGQIGYVVKDDFERPKTKPNPITTPTNSQSSKSQKTSIRGGETNTSRTIHIGPRGGRYYINSKGNKVYIKQ